MVNQLVVIRWNSSTSYLNLKNLKLSKSLLPETVKPLISALYWKIQYHTRKIKTMEEATLNSIRNRPRFKFSTKLSPVEYEQHLLEMIRANPLIHGKINRKLPVYG